MDSQDISARLERLERENHRMKKIGSIAVIFASVLFISAQSKTYKVVEANEFHLVDASDKVRAKLAMTTEVQKDIPNLSFYDAEGHSRIYIAASEGQSRIQLNDSQRSRFSAMWVGSPGISGSGVSVDAPVGVFRVILDGVIEGPQLKLEDKEGYATVIGKTDLEFSNTGKKEQPPAASLVLLNKDKKVLWSAP